MRDVPRIGQFYGIAIYMYSDHPPPHIHAQYGGVESGRPRRSGSRLSRDDAVNWGAGRVGAADGLLELTPQRGGQAAGAGERWR